MRSKVGMILVLVFIWFLGHQVALGAMPLFSYGYVGQNGTSEGALVLDPIIVVYSNGTCFFVDRQFNSISRAGGLTSYITVDLKSGFLPTSKLNWLRDKTFAATANPRLKNMATELLKKKKRPRFPFKEEFMTLEKQDKGGPICLYLRGFDLYYNTTQLNELSFVKMLCQYLESNCSYGTVPKEEQSKFIRSITYKLVEIPSKKYVRVKRKWKCFFLDSNMRENTTLLDKKQMALFIELLKNQYYKVKGKTYALVVHFEWVGLSNLCKDGTKSQT